jgi:aldehyde:ferredoxin oxidoreductase
LRIKDQAAVVYASQVCNQYGVDTLPAARPSRLPECYEKGVISKEQTGGIDLRFGDADAMLAALDVIVKNEGPLGKVLSQGSERAAAAWGNGADEFLITSKGGEAPAHMPQPFPRIDLRQPVRRRPPVHEHIHTEEGVADLN